MIEVKNVVKTFDGFAALSGATLSVPTGSVYGLVGPNGAGKSTLIRHLTGIYRQDEGSIAIAGEEIWENAALKSRILSSRGHLSNEDAGKTAVELVRRGVRGILLGHLSKENNDEQLALSTVARILEEQGIRPGKDMALGMTRKQQVTGLYTLR